MKDHIIDDILNEVTQDMDPQRAGEIKNKIKSYVIDNKINEFLNEITFEMEPQRAGEIKKELTSHIMDSAEALASERGGSVDEGIIKEVIGRMGPARNIAAMYSTKKMFTERKDMVRALISLAGIAAVFLVAALAFQLVIPDAAGLPKGEIVTVVLGIVGAMSIAILALGIIFMLLYFYESSIKLTYEDRLKRIEKSLNEVTSIPRIILLAIFNIIFVVLLVLFWDRIPMLVFEGSKMVPLFSSKFGAFVPIIVLMTLATVIVNILYLVIPFKWVPSLGETLIAAVNIIITYFVIQVFPFNPALPSLVTTGLYVLLAIGFLGCVVDTAQKLWRTTKFAFWSK